MRQAGTKALERSASRDAVTYFEQALAALDRLPTGNEAMAQGVDIRMDLRQALVHLADRTRLLDHMQKAESLARALGDQRRLSRIAYALAHYHYLSHDQERAVEDGRRALELSEDPEQAIAVNVLLGYSFHITGHYREAARVLQRNVAVLTGERVRDRFGLPAFPSVTSRERLVRCFAELGEFAEGIRQGEEGMRIAEEIDHPPSFTAMCLGLGTLYLRRADLDAAIPDPRAWHGGGPARQHLRVRVLAHRRGGPRARAQGAGEDGLALMTRRGRGGRGQERRARAVRPAGVAGRSAPGGRRP